MRIVCLRESRLLLARSAAVLLVGSLAAGCSAGVSRFTGDVLTGSTANQRSIIKDEDQPFPGDVVQSQAAPAPIARATYEPQTSSGVTRSSLPDAPRAKAPARTPAIAAAPTPARIDTTPTGTVERARPEPAPATARAPAPVQADETPHQGWSRAGGTQVTLKEGETLYNLSKRFGVPVAAIMKVNGIETADGARAGQKIVVPTYVYSSTAGVSAPDSSAKVAEASSTRGKKADAPPGDLPKPAPKPADRVAVLPQQPKVKEQATPPSTADAAAASGKGVGPEGSYTVASGDTLNGIASRFGVKASAIQQANGLTSANLKIGQRLRIPAAGATVAAAPQAPVDKTVTGATGPARKSDRPKAEPADAPLKAYTPPKREEAKAVKEVSASTDDGDAPNESGIGKMRWPVRGRVIGTYGNSSNDGIDIAVPEGTPVKAAENGVVIFAGEGLKDFGRTVLVRHKDGKVTVYGHAGELKVKRGDTVKRGQEIARSGMSGNADTPKLHFEVRENSDPVDPQQFLE